MMRAKNIFETAHVHDAHAHAGHDAVLHQQQAVNGYSVAAPVVDHHHHQHHQPISNGYAVDKHQHQQQAVDGYAVGHDFLIGGPGSRTPGQEEGVGFGFTVR